MLARMKVQRFDGGGLGLPTKMANGFLKVDAYLTRTGVFSYRNADGSTRLELRLPDEVFSQDSMDTLSQQALTLDHPSRPVTADNARGLSVGSVGAARQDGEDKIASSLMITDAEAIRAVQTKDKRQVSCGYWCDLEEKPGTTQGITGIPDGLKYDAIQRDIVYNHAALVAKGRAGPDIGARVDGEDVSAFGEGVAVMVMDEVDLPIPPEAKAPRRDNMLAFFLFMLMDEKGLTVGELASAAGVGFNEMETILSGGVIPTGKQIEDLADDLVPRLRLPTAHPLIFEFDRDLNRIGRSPIAEKRKVNFWDRLSPA